MSAKTTLFTKSIASVWRELVVSGFSGELGFLEALMWLNKV